MRDFRGLLKLAQVNTPMTAAPGVATMVVRPALTTSQPPIAKPVVTNATNFDTFTDDQKTLAKLLYDEARGHTADMPYIAAAVYNRSLGTDHVGEVIQPVAFSGMGPDRSFKSWSHRNDNDAEKAAWQEAMKQAMAIYADDYVPPTSATHFAMPNAVASWNNGKTMLPISGVAHRFYDDVRFERPWVATPMPVLTEQNMRKHKVAPGENFSKIAQKYGIPTSWIQAWNDKVDPKKLKVGSEILYAPLPAGYISSSATGKQAAKELEEIRKQRLNTTMNKGAMAYMAGFMSKCAEYGVDGKALLIKYAGPRPSEKVRGSGSVPFMPAKKPHPGVVNDKRPGMGLDRVEPNEDVKYFYDTIIPWMKRNSETAGKPGVDYNAAKFVPGFYNSVPIRYGSMGGRGGSRAEAYSDQNDGVVLGPTEFGRSPSTLVHELKHQQNNDGFWHWQRSWNPFRRKTWMFDQSGRSKADDTALYRAYGFTPETVGENYNNISNPDALASYAREEAGTTNAEYQFGIMMDLKNKLGRFPTPQELKDYIMTGMTSMEVINRFKSKVPNGYQRIALRKRDEARNENINQQLGEPPSLGRSGIYPDSMYNEVKVGYGSGSISPDDARKTDWYRENPSLFEPNLLEIERLHAKFPEASHTLSPGNMLDNAKRVEYVEKWYQYMKDHPEYSEEDIDAIRRAWGNVAKNNYGASWGGKV